MCSDACEMYAVVATLEKWATFGGTLKVGQSKQYVSSTLVTAFHFQFPVLKLQNQNAKPKTQDPN